MAGLYPLVWAVGQPLFGPMSDRVGRRPLIVAGMIFQGAGLLVLAVATTFATALSAAVLMGLGTGMVYPVLIAAVADRSVPEKRATALGVYRFFRDSGYALGALVGSLGLLDLAGATTWTGVVFAPLAALAGAALGRKSTE